MRNPWPSDAYQINYDDIEAVIFKNALVEDFLNNSRVHFVSANKGLGKTLLLTYKRYLLFAEHKAGKGNESQPDVHFIPDGGSYLDTMEDIYNLSRDHQRFLSSFENAKRVWGCSLKLSAIAHFPPLLKQRGHEWEWLPENFYEMLLDSRKKLSPTEIFRWVLRLPIKKINRVILDGESLLEIKFRSISSGVFIFIDKIDQAIRLFPQEGWVQTQAGLVEAAWDAMNINRHVKIYATIRHEAFSNYESPIKLNLLGATTILKYSIRELKEILDKLSSCYEDGKTFKEFIGFDSLRSGVHGCREDAFDYLFRHTIGRPRDLVIICSQLHFRETPMPEQEFREIVNETSSVELTKNVFDEMNVFLDCLKTKEGRGKLFSGIKQNILSREEILQICADYNEHIQAEDLKELLKHQSSDYHHPFCELYNAGLLGVVAPGPIEERKIQRFKQPNDLLTEGSLRLPRGDFYLIHPSLHFLIQKHSQDDAYLIFRYIVVGHGYEWKWYFPSMIKIQKGLQAIDNHEIRHNAGSALKEISSLFLPPEVNKTSINNFFHYNEKFLALKEALKDGGHEQTWKGFQELEQIIAELPQEFFDNSGYSHSGKFYLPPRMKN